MTLLSRFKSNDSAPAQESPVANAAARTTSVADLPLGDGLLALVNENSDAPADVQHEAVERVMALIGSGAVTDQATLCTLAIESKASRLRQAAAEAVVAAEQLQRLAKHARTKDKNVYKIVKQKFEAVLAQERAAAETQHAIELICAALERLVYAPFDNLFAPTLEHLETQWRNTNASAPPEVRTRAEQALARCRDVVARHAAQSAAQAARAAAIAGADADRSAILDELSRMLSALYSGESIANVEACKERWRGIDKYRPANKEAAVRYGKLCNAIGELQVQIEKHGTLSQQEERLATDPYTAQTLKQTLAPASLLDEAPAAVISARAALNAFMQQVAAQQTATERALHQVHGLLRAASGALRNGQSRQAAGMRHAIDTKLKSLSAVPEHIAKQLATLDEQLARLQDWRSYVVAPKRAELIEQMEALIGTSDAPQAVADKIKRLQDEWKTISKGNTDDTTVEWQKFHEAAQKAYEPCREYFAKQAQIREANLGKRKALLARLVEFAASHNWAEPNWREVAKAVREASQQWRSHQPVDRAANKPLQKQFDATLQDLESRLAEHYERNATDKRRLIARAQGLAALEDLRKATDEVKRLQLAWKEIGAAARDAEQKLWEEFRQHCDAVFAKRSEQRDAYGAALDANKAKALEICEAVEQLQTLADGKQLQPLREAFDAVGELPKASARDVRSRFERAVKRYEQRMAEARAQERTAAWDRVLEAGDKIRAYRLAALNNEAAGVSEALKADAQLFIDGVTAWPKGVTATVKAELDKPGGRNIAENEKALRTLCIRAELLTDTPTPEHDHAFRRAYQLQQLTTRMGQGAQTEETLDRLILEWIAVGPVADTVYPELFARLQRCRGHGPAGV